MPADRKREVQDSGTQARGQIEIDLAPADARSWPDVTDYAREITGDPAPRETARKNLAFWVVGLFGGSILLLLGGGLYVIASLAPGTGKALIHDAYLPLVQSVAIFCSTVFGPLLVFILGFYFGQQQK